MATNDITQTYKQYKDRKQRLKVKKKFDDRENVVLNEIEDINKKINKLNKLKDQKIEEANEINAEKLESLSRTYNNSFLLSEIVEYAKKTIYSSTNLEEIEELCNTGVNFDNINMELIEKIASAEESINTEIRHTTRLGDILDNLGGNIKLPGEGQK